MAASAGIGPTPLCEVPELVAMFREGLRRAGKTEVEIVEIEQRVRREISETEARRTASTLFDPAAFAAVTELEWPATRGGR